MTNEAIVQYKLRSANREDESEITSLLSRADLPLDGVSEMLDDFVVAVLNDRIIGAAGVERCGDYGLLRSVAVDPDFRGLGIGGAVVDRAIARAEDTGIKTFYLLTTTAENYFPSFGFEQIARDEAPDAIRNTTQFKDLCPSSATLMRLVPAS